MATAPSTRTLGPRHQRDAKMIALSLSLYAAQLQAAVEANNLDRAADLQGAIAMRNIELTDILSRARKARV